MKKIIFLVIVLCLFILIFITPFEAQILRQELGYLYFLNIGEIVIAISSIMTGIFFTLAYIHKNYVLHKKEQNIK